MFPWNWGKQWQYRGYWCLESLKYFWWDVCPCDLCTTKACLRNLAVGWCHSSLFIHKKFLFSISFQYMPTFPLRISLLITCQCTVYFKTVDLCQRHFSFQRDELYTFIRSAKCHSQSCLQMTIQILCLNVLDEKLTTLRYGLSISP